MKFGRAAPIKRATKTDIPKARPVIPREPDPRGYDLLIAAAKEGRLPVGIAVDFGWSEGRNVDCNKTVLSLAEKLDQNDGNGITFLLNAIRRACWND